jgi:hypothetical protein
MKSGQQSCQLSLAYLPTTGKYFESVNKDNWRMRILLWQDEFCPAVLKVIVQSPLPTQPFDNIYNRLVTLVMSRKIMLKNLENILELNSSSNLNPEHRHNFILKCTQNYDSFQHEGCKKRWEYLLIKVGTTVFILLYVCLCVCVIRYVLFLAATG